MEVEWGEPWRRDGQETMQRYASIWRSPAGRRFLGVGLWVVLCAAISATASAEVAYTNSQRFRIPFDFDADEIARLKVQSVQLYVSTDRGRTWQAAGSAPPKQGYVAFEASGDGEYLFSVKTRSENGTVLPQGGHQVALEVAVDTTPPELKIRLDEAEPGRVRLSWNAQDAALDTDSLTLEFLDSKTAQWQPVGVRAAGSGQTTWSVDRGGVVEVRGYVRDRAGNERYTETKASITAGVVRPADPDFTRPVAKSPADQPATGANLPAIIPYRNTGISVPAYQPATVAKQAVETPQTEIPLPPAIPAVPATAEIPMAQPLMAPPAAVETSVAMANASAGLPSLPGSSFNEPASLAAPPVHRVSRQLVNSTQFQIEYGVKAVGPSGVRSVNLYITEDGGQKWWHYDTDPDHQSPAEVIVPQDGEYGFTFRVESGAGYVAPPPQPGDSPDLTIVVDRVAPTVQMYPLEQPQPEARGLVPIRWACQDRDLPERPVALYYSMSPTGPWKLIEGANPNSGLFQWPLPETRATERIYVRVEVRDLAGNTGFCESMQPLLIDFARPAIEVLGVQSVSGPRR